MKKFLQDYLSFTAKERVGIFTILFIVLLCAVAPFFFPYFIHHKEYDHSAFDSEMALLKMKVDTTVHRRFYTNDDDDEPGGFKQRNYPSYKNYERSYSKISGELFYFDPNIASASDWKKLGVRDKTIETIQKYLSKGGHFYKPEDIRKIWGLHEDDITRLMPYVRIEEPKTEFVRTSYSEPKKLPEKKFDQQIDINVADTSLLIALPGIGTKLAQRIITFRDKLGGFYSVDQVGQTFGLADSTFQKIKSRLILQHAAIKQIDINSATIDEMKSHPYLRYNLANAIIQYRTQHGNFSSVNDVKNIMLFTDEVFNKVAPYLTAK